MQNIQLNNKTTTTTTTHTTTKKKEKKKRQIEKKTHIKNSAQYGFPLNILQLDTNLVFTHSRLTYRFLPWENISSATPEYHTRSNPLSHAIPKRFKQFSNTHHSLILHLNRKTRYVYVQFYPSNPLPKL